MIVLLTVACVLVRPPAPTEAMVAHARQGAPDATLESLARGCQTLLRRCGGCHALPEPAVTTAPEWPALLAEMSDKARLSPEQVELLSVYLDAAAHRDVGLPLVGPHGGP